MNPLLLTDGYKTSHNKQYPKGTRLVYSNFTPRSNKYAPKGCNEVVVFGTQMVMTQLHEMFQKDFFHREKEEVCSEIKRELSLYLNGDYDVSHFEALHDLGYLPICVKGLEEGTKAPIKVPVLTIYNTHPDFFWITNYLETILSNLLWKPMTSATIAHQYRKVLTSWMQKTDKENAWFIDWQGHDFSMRGMDSVDAVISSGLGHLTSFLGTDSLPAIYGARKYYGADGFVAGSVPATEHSVMCAGGKEDEVETFRRLLKTYPTGILSVVSDTWDLWKVCTEHVVTLKDEIMSRDGKLVIRPDSGDPVDILCGKLEIQHDIDTRESLEQEDLFTTFICNPKKYVIQHGDSYYEGKSVSIGGGYSEGGNSVRPDFSKPVSTSEVKGIIELLWDVFGGTINEQGYKVLDPHIGAIYGDSITIERADEICRRLEAKGFASTNVVLGIGSFTYQYNTRDTFGFAMKATYVEIKHWDVATERLNETMGKNANPEWIEGREIFKNPITDDGTKKSATGLLSVIKSENDTIQLVDKVNWETERTGLLKPIYEDGMFYNRTTLEKIREKLK